MASRKLSVRTRRLMILGALLMLLGIAVFIPLPQSVTCPCAIEPSAVWSITQDGAGQIVTGWQHNLLFPAGGRTMVHLDRPDIIQVKLAPQLKEGSRVAQGDTIVFINSEEAEGMLRSLEAERDKARAELMASLTGERLEDQEIAHREVTLAQTALDEFTPKFNRVKELYETGSASRGEWEAVQGQQKLLSAECELAEAKLKASRAGSRAEDVLVLKSEVNRLRQSIENIQSSLLHLQAIVTPIAGTVRLGGENGEAILRIDRTDSMVAVIPVPEAVAAKVREEQSLEIRLFTQPGAPLKGVIKRIEYRDSVGYTAGVIVLLDNRKGELHGGMNGIAKLPMGELTIWEGILIKLGIQG